MSEEKHKIESLANYLIIYVLLMVLLVLTVIAAAVDLGRWNTVISLLIAALKAILVILFFMHVRHSSRLTWVFAAAAFLWLGLLLGLTMTDYRSRDTVAPDSSSLITAPAGAVPYR